MKILQKLGKALHNSKSRDSETHEHETVKTRFMIISDTHGHEFDPNPDRQYPAGYFFKPPFPEVDVLLHCGDLTTNGSYHSLVKALEMLSTFRAKLKLVIAGEHDLCLDKDFSSNSGTISDLDHKRARELMFGPLAAKAGVTYLEKGKYVFTLSNGARLTVFASPYQPIREDFVKRAFTYERTVNHFQALENIAKTTAKSIAKEPIESFPAVDIVMTHGPPCEILDMTTTTYRTAGCPHLIRAISRARPKLHAFGHIHEAYGTRWIVWKQEPEQLGLDAIERTEEAVQVFQGGSVTPVYPESAIDVLPEEFGKRTLMVNASITNKNYEVEHAPILVNLELQKAT